MVEVLAAVGVSVSEAGAEGMLANTIVLEGDKALSPISFRADTYTL